MHWRLDLRNHKEKLDPALIRPGRADIEVEFKNATRAIYRDLFKVFYPVVGEFPVTHARATDVGTQEKSKDTITKEEIDVLADQFASALPAGEFSPAQIQGKYL
jgi:chaperone BCS1